MSEQKKYNHIEDAIIESLDDGVRENALNFAAYLNENQLKPNMSAWGKISFGGYNLGWMRVEGSHWLFQILIFLILATSTTQMKSLSKLYMTT